jgi:AcrR family transcriptional regulator
MSPRPRSISDADILAAAARIIDRTGAAGLTLGDVGAEIGLAPATLLQRFGSKHGLLAAVARTSVESVDVMFADVRAEHSSAVAALISAASAMAQTADCAAAAGNRAAFLRTELDDPEVRAHALEHARRIREGYRRLVEEAVADGELAECEPARLASAVESIACGALLSWAAHGDGDPATFVRRDVTTLLQGYGKGIWANR